MWEITPPAPEETRRLERSLMEKVLDNAASDPWWKQRLLDDPETAVLEAGFPEAERLQELHVSLSREEVEGHEGPCILAIHLLEREWEGANLVRRSSELPIRHSRALAQ